MILGPCESVTLCDKRDFAKVMKVPDLKIRKLSWIVWVGLLYSHVLSEAENCLLEGEKEGRRGMPQRANQRNACVSVQCIVAVLSCRGPQTRTGEASGG